MRFPALSRLQSNPWMVVGLLWVAGCLNYLDRLMITTMRGSIKEAIAMSEAQFGLLTTMVLVVYGICSPFAGYFADRLSRSSVITGCVFAWSVVTGLTAFAQTYEQLLALRALLAISQVACVPASVALVVEYHRGSTRSVASGLLLGGAMAGAALSGLGGWLATGPGWEYPHKLFGAIGAAYAVVLLVLLRDPPADAAERVEGEATVAKIQMGEAFRGLLANRNYLLILVYNCVLGVVAWSVVGWMPTFVKERFSLSQGEAGMSTTIYLNVAGTIGLIVGGKWADRWARRDERARLLVPMIGLSLAAPAVLLIAKAPVLGFALAGLVLYGFGRYFADANMMPILCLLVDPRYRATSWGLTSLFSTIVGGAGIYAGGLLRDAHVDISRVFQFAAINLLVSALLMFTIYRRLGRRA